MIVPRINDSMVNDGQIPKHGPQGSGSGSVFITPGGTKPKGP